MPLSGAETALPPRKSLRLALLMGLAPRKLGSFEDWLLAMSSEARRRNHRLDIFGLLPIHSAIAEQFKRDGTGWKPLDVLTASPLRSTREMAGYDLLYLCMFGAYDRVSLMAYGAWPARIVIAVHSDLGEPKRRARLAQLISVVARRIFGRRVDGLVAVSDYVRVRHLDWWRFAQSKTRTIYNGIDIHRFAPRSSPAAPRPATLLSAANLVPGKGLATLLRAMSGLRDSTVQLMIAGDGPEKEPLQLLAKSLGLETRVSFLGLRNDIPDLLRSADIYVLPSNWPEAFPLAVLEAMAAECAVVASAVGGVPEAIEHGTTGLLVKPGDENGLADALNLLIENPELRARLGKAGRSRVIERFNLSRCVQEHFDWCERVLSSRPARQA